MSGDPIVALDEEVHDTIARGHASPGWLIDPRTSFDRERGHVVASTRRTELKRFEEAKSLLRRIVPVARRVLGEGNEHTLKMRKIYARALFDDPAATLDDFREAVTTLEDSKRIARRVFGGSHPDTTQIELALGSARDALRARETPST